MGVLESKRPLPLVIDPIESPVWAALLETRVRAETGAVEMNAGCTSPLLGLRGTAHAERLVSGLVAMIRAPGLAPFMRPFHRRSKTLQAFGKLAEEVAKGLDTTPSSPLVAAYIKEMSAAKSQIYNISHASGAEAQSQKESLCSVVSSLDSRASGVAPARRATQLGKALRGSRSRATVLWRFGSAGVAAHDALDGGEVGDGDDIVLVRAAAALAPVEVVSGSEFTQLARQAKLKHEKGAPHSPEPPSPKPPRTPPRNASLCL